MIFTLGSCLQKAAAHSQSRSFRRHARFAMKWTKYQWIWLVRFCDYMKLLSLFRPTTQPSSLLHGERKCSVRRSQLEFKSVDKKIIILAQLSEYQWVVETREKSIISVSTKSYPRAQWSRLVRDSSAYPVAPLVEENITSSAEEKKVNFDKQLIPLFYQKRKKKNHEVLSCYIIQLIKQKSPENWLN